MKRGIRMCAAAALLTGLAAGSVRAEEQKFEPKMDISSQTGKWKQDIKEKPVKLIGVTVKRISGGEDTFINFRFGDDGKTFPDGQRFYLKDDKQTQFRVQANNRMPGNKPLVINAYNGTVRLIYVTIHYPD